MAPSQIAFRGFLLGYMHKTAAMPKFEASPRAPLQSAEAEPLPDPKGMFQGQQQGPLRPEGQAPEVPGGKGGYGDLLSLLKSVAPGAAIGAGVVGAGSVAVDAAQKKPVNIKRALILSMLLGVPLGVAGNIAATGAGGGPGFGSAGRTIAGAGKQLGKDVTGKAGELFGNVKEQFGKGMSKAKGLGSQAATAVKGMGS
jgi:hypothetical protein